MVTIYIETDTKYSAKLQEKPLSFDINLDFELNSRLPDSAYD